MIQPPGVIISATQDCCGLYDNVGCKSGFRYFGQVDMRLTNTSEGFLGSDHCPGPGTTCCAPEDRSAIVVGFWSGPIPECVCLGADNSSTASYRSQNISARFSCTKTKCSQVHTLSPNMSCSVLLNFKKCSVQPPRLTVLSAD